MTEGLANVVADDSDITRKELHWRRIDFHGFLRSDGLLEVEAQLTDRKTHDFAPPSGVRTVSAGEFIHDHGLKVVFDNDMVIRKVDTAIRSYPYRECTGGGDILQALVGLRIGPGWSTELRKRLPASEACTHLREMMIPLASAAYQTFFSVQDDQASPVDMGEKPKKIDSCYAYNAKRELVRMHWPEHHKPGGE